MPLLDHFRPPLDLEKPWSSFHHVWITTIVQQLNGGILPKPFYAIPSLHRGQIEIDVATVSGTDAKEDSAPPSIWAPQAASFSATVDVTDLKTYAVHVINREEGPPAVAAIEIVSLSNKNRPTHRQAFAVKCANYLYERIHLQIVDVVTVREQSLHRELLELLPVTSEIEMEDFPNLYVASYRAVPNAKSLRVDVWIEELAVGEPLPTMPLRIADDLHVPIDLESSHRKACEALSIL